MTLPLTPAEVAAGRRNDKIGTDFVAETGGMRIGHGRLAPGETLAANRQSGPCFWTVPTDGNAVSTYDDGRIAETACTAGQIRHFEDLSPPRAFIHPLTNTGSQDLHFINVEFER